MKGQRQTQMILLEKHATGAEISHGSLTIPTPAKDETPKCASG